MPTVNLTDQEWQQVIGVIAQAPWHVANPLLMKIGDQLRVQQPPAELRQADYPLPEALKQPGFKRSDMFEPPDKVNG